MSFHYFAYGLNIQSELPLPELLHAPENEAVRASVVIRKGRCELPPEVLVKEAYGRLRDDRADFHWRDVGSFRVRKNEILVEPAPGVADHLLRPFLLGSVIAFLLHLHGFLVLHCSAIALPDPKGELGVVAFLGQSGLGKSTMATALKERGHLVVADDIIAVPTPESTLLTDDGPSGTNSPRIAPLIFAGPSYLKLRTPSAETFGAKVEELTLWHPDDHSYVIPHETHQSAPPLPLRCLYVLEAAEQVNIQSMEPQEALMALVNHSYCVRNISPQGVAHNFHQCSWLTRQRPCFRLQRPRNFNYLPEVVQRVEDHQGSF